jgi:hypothetical protein
MKPEFWSNRDAARRHMIKPSEPTMFFWSYKLDYLVAAQKIVNARQKEEAIKNNTLDSYQPEQITARTYNAGKNKAKREKRKNAD